MAARRCDDAQRFTLTDRARAAATANDCIAVKSLAGQVRYRDEIYFFLVFRFEATLRGCLAGS